MSIRVGEEISSARYGRFRIISRLGEGGMAEVFLAEAVSDTGTMLQLALKIMKAGVSEESFAEEADLMGLLKHPNLVQRMEIGTWRARPFIAMEFLVGGDLRELLIAHKRSSQSVPLGIATHITLEVCKALAYFHSATTASGTPLGLVHSDVNPANIFFSGLGEVKLGDFGVASSRHANIGPGEGVAAGKLSYLSPEVIRGEPVSLASDLFGTGVMLYEMVAGTHPFVRPGMPEGEAFSLIRAARYAPVPGAHPMLNSILQKALAGDPRNRFKSAAELGGALFHHVLEQNLCRTPADVQEWLRRTLGLML